MDNRRERFRRLLSEKQCSRPAPVIDPLSARAAETLGYPAGILGGSAAALAVLGAPDLALLTLTELVDQAHRICRASTLPLLVDADHGYGGPLNVARTVEELEAVGVAALTIEDTNLPEIVTDPNSEPLIPLDAGCAKMKAAVKARRDPSLVVIARTSAASSMGTDEAVKRCKAYEACGVDAIFLAGLSGDDQLETIARHLSLPIVRGIVRQETSDLEKLSQLGVRLALKRNEAISASTRAYCVELEADRQSCAGKLSKRDDLVGELTRRVT